MLTIKSLFEEI